MIFIIIGDLIGVPVIYEYARTDPDTRNPDTYRTDISYEQIAIDPDNYQSENIVISGTVIQLLEDKSTTNQIRVAVNNDMDKIIMVD